MEAKLTILERIPFSEAIGEENFLKNAWDQLSTPQKVALKALYGLPLEGIEEQKAWAVFQESCTYDELGAVTSWTPTPYPETEFERAWAVFGRRSGKTDKFIAFILVYEAALGGHMQYAGPKQDVICYLVAQNQTVARSHLAFVRQIIESSPVIQRTLEHDLVDSIKFTNGIQICPASPSVKAQRGMAIPIVAMDEIGFWYTEPDAANPDFEVVRALTWAQGQFPHKKQIGCSTPWGKEGLLWENYNAGTQGSKLQPGEDKTKYRRTLVMHCPTLAIENPLFMDRGFFEIELANDPESYQRESLGRFVDSISGFLSPALLREAVDIGVNERPPLPNHEHPDIKPHYVAAIDPAFKRDSFAFAICHSDPAKGIVVDLVREFKPSPGTALNPKMILEMIVPIMQAYRIEFAYSDQYHFESFEQLALDMDLPIEKVNFSGSSKAKIYGSLQQLVNQKRLRLLDPKTSADAATTYSQLASLERHLTGMGNVQIGAPKNRHDDMATVVALGVYKAVWLLPEQLENTQSQRTREQDHVAMGMASIKANKAGAWLNDQYGGLWN